MNTRNLLNLQEAYMDVYDGMGLSEEYADLVSEYLYENGFDKYDIEDLIENIGLDEFIDCAYNILEECGVEELNEVRLRDRFARAVLAGIERHQRAQQTPVGQKINKFASRVGKGLTTAADVADLAGRAAALRLAGAIERRTPKPSTSSRPALPPAGRTSGSSHLTGEPMNSGQRAVRNQQATGVRTGASRREFAKTTQTLAARGSKGSGTRYVGPPTRPTPLLPAARSTPLLPPARQSSTSKGGKAPSKSPTYGKPDASGQGNLFNEIPKGQLSSAAPSPKRKSISRSTKSRKKPSSSTRQTTLLTRKEFKNIKENVELWVNSLIEEGYDLSGYTWDDMYDMYEEALLSDYQYVLEHLIDEGYADDLNSAGALFESMSDEWIQDILEVYDMN